jgi:hypothetical protein
MLTDANAATALGDQLTYRAKVARSDL